MARDVQSQPALANPLSWAPSKYNSGNRQGYFLNLAGADDVSTQHLVGKPRGAAVGGSGETETRWQWLVAGYGFA